MRPYKEFAEGLIIVLVLVVVLVLERLALVYKRLRSEFSGPIQVIARCA